MPDDLADVFEELKALLKKHARQMVVEKDAAGDYYLNTRQVDAKQRPVFFAAAQIRKKYVSFHLMPVYCFPELLNDISPALKRARQGKSCFNFNAVDRPLFKELAALTRRSLDRYRQEEMA